MDPDLLSNLRFGDKSPVGCGDDLLSFLSSFSPLALTCLVQRISSGRENMGSDVLKSWWPPRGLLLVFVELDIWMKHS
jgi:hypothetical protein